MKEHVFPEFIKDSRFALAGQLKLATTQSIFKVREVEFIDCLLKQPVIASENMGGIDFHWLPWMYQNTHIKI